MVEKIDNNTLRLSGRVDSSNAAQFETELLAAAEQGDITLDAEALEYVSSAGLRVLLKLKKSLDGELSIINVSKELYDIFDVTGFTNILNIKKALRRMSIEGLEVIGRGATGTVYRIDSDTIIKVFNKNIGLYMIENESRKAKNAFLFGVPTAISYDMVRVGECYGVVYEMLNARDLSDVIKNDKAHLEEHIRNFALKMKQMHTIEVDDRFIDVKTTMLQALGRTEGKLCTTEELKKMCAVIESVPDRNTFIHGDAHIGNVMLQNGEYMFIDLSGSGKGHPIFDMASMCVMFRILGQRLDAETRQKIELIRDFTPDEMQRIWDKYLRTYLDTDDEAFLKKAERQITAITCARVFPAGVAVPGMFSDATLEFFKRTVLDYYDSGMEPVLF